jgi:hypothetical protein
MKSNPTLSWLTNNELLQRVECQKTLSPLERELACRLRVVLETISTDEAQLGEDLRKFANTAKDYMQSTGEL